MSKSKEIASWKEAIQADAKKVAHNEGTDSSAITIQHGRMMYREQMVPDNKMNGIVIASTTERCYYDKPYDPDKISSPRCFAQSLESRELVPHENVVEPMAATCAECPMAEFGSAKVGKGPACKTYRKIMLLPEKVMAEDVPKVEMAYLKVSPTSVKNWSKYAQHLVASAGIPPWAAITQIEVVPDKKTIHQVTFKGVGPIQDEELLSAIHARIDEAERKLMTPYTYEDEEAEAASGKY